MLTNFGASAGGGGFGASYVGPKVKVCLENDIRLAPPGKKCARAGLPNPPGSMARSQSQPTMVLTCPGSALHAEQQRSATLSRQHFDRLRDVSGRSHFATTGCLPESSFTLRAPSAGEQANGGGRTQGAIVSRVRSVGEPSEVHPEFDGTKHGWHDPRGQAEVARLRDPSQPGSWAWTTRKARDHVGYGSQGMVAKGDVQGTAVSGDGPAWFVGPKTVDGPFNTKSVPVRRCPKNFIDPATMTMCLHARTFKQGHGLTVVQTIHSRERPPSSGPHAGRFQGNRCAEDTRPEYMKRAAHNHNRAKQCSFHAGGGCQSKAQVLPSSSHRSCDDYTAPSAKLKGAR